MSGTALVIMTRYPERGKVKTRLAQSIGEEGALQLYQAFLIDLAQRFADQDYALHWAYTPAHADFAQMMRALVGDLPKWGKSFPQEGEELGERLHRVFRAMRAEGFKQIIVIASDSPHISRNTIARATQELGVADVVLGPAHDGGYYLIAMREPHDVFSGIPMSTEVVLQMTIEKAQHLGLTVALLEPLFDVDEVPDLLLLEDVLRQQSHLAPTTAAWFAAFADVLRDIGSR